MVNKNILHRRIPRIIKAVVLTAVVSCSAAGFSQPPGKAEAPDRASEQKLYKYDVILNPDSLFDSFGNYPDASECVRRYVLFVRAKHSPVMDRFLQFVDSADLHGLFPKQKFFDIKSYFLRVSASADDSDASSWKWNLNSVPDTVNIAASRHITMTLTEMNLMPPEAKYCFSYGGRLIFTCQWIDGLLGKGEMPMVMYMDPVKPYEPAVIWRCVFENHKPVKEAVVLIGIVKDRIWAYDFMKKKYFRER